MIQLRINLDRITAQRIKSGFQGPEFQVLWNFQLTSLFNSYYTALYRRFFCLFQRVLTIPMNCWFCRFWFSDHIKQPILSQKADTTVYKEVKCWKNELAHYLGQFSIKLSGNTQALWLLKISFHQCLHQLKENSMHQQYELKSAIFKHITRTNYARKQRTVFLLTDPVMRPPWRLIKSSASSRSKLYPNQRNVIEKQVRTMRRH